MDQNELKYFMILIYKNEIVVEISKRRRDMELFKPTNSLKKSKANFRQECDNI